MFSRNMNKFEVIYLTYKYLRNIFFFQWLNLTSFTPVFNPGWPYKRVLTTITSTFFLGVSGSDF